MNDEFPYQIERVTGARKGEEWRVTRDGRAVLYASRYECLAALKALRIWMASPEAAREVNGART